MQIKTPQVKLALRIEAATVEDDVLVLRGLAGFLPCEARITAPEVRHLLRLLLRRESLLVDRPGCLQQGSAAAGVAGDKLVKWRPSRKARGGRPLRTRGGHPVTHAAITGWGKCMPPAVLTNAELETLIETSDEWIVSRTGIRERRISHVNLEELGYVAAKRALAAAGMDPADLELIVFGTCSFDDQVPNQASGIQVRLGAKKAASMDVNTACTSFLYGLSTATAMIRTGVVRNALVLGGELISAFMDWNNRGVSVLFGDGCAAVVLEATDREEGLLAERLGCDSDARQTLVVEGMGTRYANYTRMYGDTNWIFEGQEIFKRAVLGMSGACADVLKSRHLTARGHRPRRAAPGQPADHRGRCEARGNADGEGVRERAPLRQHVRRNRARGAGRGDRGRPGQAGEHAAAARVRCRTHLVRAPRALGRPGHAQGLIRRGTAAVRPDGPRDGAGIQAQEGSARGRHGRVIALARKRPPAGRDG